LNQTAENPGKSATVAFETLGCKLNQAETELLSRQLAESGYKIVSVEDHPDIFILNTCTVTHVADRKSRQIIRMVHRRNPKAKIIATGCYAEIARHEVKRIEGVDLVVGNKDKLNVKQLLESSGLGKYSKSRPMPIQFKRTRSFIRVQDGCSQFCSYCIVPFARGQEKSLTSKEVIDQINQRVEEGYQEIVLTGTEIGRYNDQEKGLKELLKDILLKTNIPRLRVSSLQPPEISPDLIHLWKNPRLCRHFHLSLQSGSDTVLKRMHRRYTTADYTAAVRLLKSEMPEIAITTDLIVGFPGETEKEFQDSLDFCLQMESARIHVFPFSPRKGTLAEHMTHRVQAQSIKDRSERTTELAQTSLLNYHRRFIQRTEDVLFEQFAGGYYSGYTSTYIKTFVRNESDITNKIYSVRLVGIHEEGMVGEIVHRQNGGKEWR
jgi:threonylcarbamoyladenosine tRNA methylthiotransferase MtaB